MLYPTISQAHELLQRYKVDDALIDHSIEVSNNAVAIGTQLNLRGARLDLSLLAVSGLLHDIGRYRSMEYHEYETSRILAEVGYWELGEMLMCHPLGGLTKEETKALGFPAAVDMIPKTLEIKILCIADKIRPKLGITTLDQKIGDYKTNPRLDKRYFTKLPGLREATIERVSSIWHELEEMGMDTSRM